MVNWWKFFFFFKLHEITPAKVKDVELLQKTYPNDLATCFVNECVQFQGHIKNIEVNLTTIQMLQFIREHDFTSVCPYVEVALRNLLYTPSTNCSTEAFFFHIKMNKKLFTVYNIKRPLLSFNGISNWS
jgi:hypothetical protein